MVRLRLGSAALLLATSAGCGDATGISPGEVEGDWNATVVEFTNLANASEQEEMIAGGATLTLSLGAAGTYTLVATPAGGSAGVDTGTWIVTDGDLVLDGSDDPIRFDAHRTGDVLTLTTNSAEHDFGSGSDEPARLRLVLSKR